MGVFLAYFPTWLKFHELFRLGAYIHPFDFISNVYSNDLEASNEYLVHGDRWESKFGALKDFGDPFALLAPAMQEGSALGGPFLPLECTLSEVHHRMGLGSIWTIGLPLMPASVKENGGKSWYRLYAFPKHWQAELPVRLADTLPGISLAIMASVTTPIHEDDISRRWRSMSSQIDRRHSSIAYHIGLKLGTPTGKIHPGWTTHLPGKDGLLCQRYGCHDLPKPQFGPTVTRSELQNAISKYALGSRSQNLSPTQPLTSTRPQVRFGSPINLVEVGSADAVRWNPPFIGPDSFEARIVPGMPVEGHGPPVSAQPSQILAPALKRRATDDLYHPGTPKKMKTASETHLNLEGLDVNDTCRLMGHAHEEVLGVAAMAGLLNPMHFEVGPSGTIGLTEFGSMAAAGPETTTTDPETFQNLERRRRALITTELRYFMDQGGFWEKGHISMPVVQYMLDEKSLVSPENLLDYVLWVYKSMASTLADLLDTAKTLMSQRHELMTDELTTAIMRALNALHRQHQGGGVSPATRLKVANTDPGRPRLEMVQYLVGITKNYLDMFVFSDAALNHTRPLPDEYAEQLARSLEQQKQLSTDIQRLLTAYDDEF
ncbi:hypothetical protein CEP54_004479 [Fusarium duplospermum]|uniref:Uncharacterized protein n=1 Tax=Fusarium duplospermum TaxID=1325734 RepID=A0A428QI98_9HYPO|nr:hypothetical protein CEP54_004479 [Fusarium duplospermum]